MWTAAALGCVISAFAEPVILWASPAEDVTRVVAERGVASGPVRTIPLAELRGRPAFLDGTGRAWGCNTVAEGTLALHLDTARRAMGYTRLLEADDALDDALGLAVCQHAPDRVALGRVWFLKGVVATWLEDPDRARRAFLNARALDPDLVWDEQYADGRAAFDDFATPLPAELRLSILPDPDGAVKVDGRGRAGPATRSSSPPAATSSRSGGSRRSPSASTSRAARPDGWRDLDLLVRNLVPDTPGPWGFYAPPERWWGPTAAGPFDRVPPPVAPRAPRGPVPASVWIGAGIGAPAGIGAGVCTVGGIRAGREVRANTAASYADFARSLDTYRSLGSLAVAAVGLVRHVGGRDR